MQSVTQKVKHVFSQALIAAFPTIPKQEPIISLANPKFGDYQCNNAMALFKQYKAELNLSNPEAFALEIEKNIPENDVFEKVIVAKPGFITVTISKKWITERVQDLCKGPITLEGIEKKKAAVDFSSPNIAKDMHVGHLRSTIIGESTCRILEFCGYEVDRINHTGDWGTQFGMLIEYMRDEYPDFGTSTPNIQDLQTFYKAAKCRFDDDESFKKRAQLAVVDLQSGGAEATKAWKSICDVSRNLFEIIYKRLDISVYERGESFYNDMIPDVVKMMEEKGLMEEDKGAKICWCHDATKDFPLIVVKGDGGYGYDSTDMAAIYHRAVLNKNDWVICITDMGQETHFKMINDAAKRMGWLNESNRADHVGFGVVLGEDGKKFKTRSGETVKLVDLLDEAVERATVELQKRREEQEDKASDEEITRCAEIIGMAAIKYADLKSNRQNNYKFSFDKMLDPKGDTAVYLLYAYARICSIFRKTNHEQGKVDISTLELNEPAERDLALTLMKFPEVIHGFLQNLNIHPICELCYEITNKFTAFYRDCKVAGDPQQESRLVLCEATRVILKQLFTLLGIEPIEKI